MSSPASPLPEGRGDGRVEDLEAARVKGFEQGIRDAADEVGSHNSSSPRYIAQLLRDKADRIAALAAPVVAVPGNEAGEREPTALSVEWALIRGPETLQPGTVFLSRESSHCPYWSREVEADALRLMRQAVRDVTRGPWSFFSDDDMPAPVVGDREEKP